MSKSLRFSALSPARQAMVRFCQAINHGSIEDLMVENGEPIFDGSPVMVKDVKLDSSEGPRPEATLEDFVLADEVLRLMGQLDEIRHGTIRRIEVRGGIPRRLLVESQRPGWPGATSNRGAKGGDSRRRRSNR